LKPLIPPGNMVNSSGIQTIFALCRSFQSYDYFTRKLKDCSKTILYFSKSLQKIFMNFG
jgi:hypothetical protein